MRGWRNVAAILAAAAVAGEAAGEPRCRTEHALVGEHPSFAHTPWSRDLQGIAHDDENWFVTNVDGLYRIPASIDLGSRAAPSTPEGWLAVAIPPALVALGFDHLGDLTWHRHAGAGYLCIAVERGDATAALAFFRGSDLAYRGHALLPEGESYAPLCAIDAGGHAVLPTERASPRFRRYRVDWDGVASGRPGALQPLGDLALRGETGTPFTERHIGGATFSPDGRLLYVLTGFYDDHACPIWSARFWRGACAIDPDQGGIHVFDVRSRRGDLCAGTNACEGVRIERSHNAQDRASSRFAYRYRGTWLRNEEPEGLTFWDLDAETAPNAPGSSGQLHALMLDNEFPTRSDLASLRHYRAQVKCPNAGARTRREFSSTRARSAHGTRDDD